jgi:hypothetical protein
LFVFLFITSSASLRPRFIGKALTSTMDSDTSVEPCDQKPDAPKLECAPMLTDGSEDAGQSTHSTSPTSGASPSLHEVIESLFGVEQLRDDDELMAHMNGRMLISAHMLCKHSRIVAMQPTVTVDDIVVCGRSTRKFVLEEYPQGCFLLGPLPQAHQKSRCAMSLRPAHGSAPPPVEAVKILCDMMPSRAAAQALLFNGAHPRILHHYWCPISQLIILNFENDTIAKQAFLDLQQKKLPNGIVVEVRIRIDNQNAVFYSNQGAPINTSTKQRSSTTERGSNHHSSGPLQANTFPPMVQNQNGNHYQLPSMFPGMPMGMMGFPPFSPFLMPFMVPPMVNPVVPRHPLPLQPNTQQPGQSLQQDPSPAMRASDLGVPIRPVQVGESAGRAPTKPDAQPASIKTSNVVAAPPVLAVPHSSSPSSPHISEKLQVSTTPLTPATSLSDSLSTPSVTKYRLDPYSNKGRVVQEERLSPDTSMSCATNVKSVAPPTIDVFCLPQPRSAMDDVLPPGQSTAASRRNKHPPQWKSNRRDPQNIPGASLTHFPALEDPPVGRSLSTQQRVPLPTGVPSVDERSPVVGAPNKATYASILLGAARSSCPA